MYKFITTLFFILLTVNIQAQEPPKPRSTQKTQLLLNITIPCREDGIKFISELVNLYGEQEFASGTFKFKPLMKPNMVESDLLMYVAPDKSTFSIFSLHKVGELEVACVLAGGTNLRPFRGNYRNND
jgi:hypothetical protein